MGVPPVRLRSVHSLRQQSLRVGQRPLLPYLRHQRSQGKVFIPSRLCRFRRTPANRKESFPDPAQYSPGDCGDQGDGGQPQNDGWQLENDCRHGAYIVGQTIHAIACCGFQTVQGMPVNTESRIDLELNYSSI